jgi:hypothetical protein
MHLVDLIEAHSVTLVDEAATALSRVHLHHYESSGQVATRQHLHELMERLTHCLRHNTLLPMVEHAEGIAQERFHGGYGLGEIQSAFNTLEETLWRFLVREVPRDEVTDGLARMGAVLGQGKDHLALVYVDLAGRHHAPALNEKALFQGVMSA